MCCGRDEPSEAEIVMAVAPGRYTIAEFKEAVSKTLEDAMAKKAKEPVMLYTTSPGAEVTVGAYGMATNTVGVSVPADQVESLTAEGLLGTEPLEEPNTRASRKAARESKER